MEVGWLMAKETEKDLHTAREANQIKRAFIQYLKNVEGTESDRPNVIAVTLRRSDGAFYTGIGKDKVEALKKTEAVEYLAAFDREKGLAAWTSMPASQFADFVCSDSPLPGWYVKSSKDGERWLITIKEDGMKVWNKPRQREAESDA